jgi:hypothetical protein
MKVKGTGGEGYSGIQYHKIEGQSYLDLQVFAKHTSARYDLDGIVPYMVVK